MLGIEPYVCANFGTGSWVEAQQWVEYCNLASGTALTKLRQKNGREKPWKVTYWGLGNEMDGPWQMGHRTAEDYGKFALEAAKLMKWTDKDVKLIAAGSSKSGLAFSGMASLSLNGAFSAPRMPGPDTDARGSPTGAGEQPAGGVRNPAR